MAQAKKQFLVDENGEKTAVLLPIEEYEAPMNEYTAVIKRDGDWWIGWIEEVPGVNCQEATRDELLVTLRVTLKEILEINKAESIAFAGSDFQTERIAL